MVGRQAVREAELGVLPAICLAAVARHFECGRGKLGLKIRISHTEFTTRREGGNLQVPLILLLQPLATCPCLVLFCPLDLVTRIMIQLSEEQKTEGPFLLAIRSLCVPSPILTIFCPCDPTCSFLP